MMTALRSVIMVGAFPPPVHGMSAINAVVREMLEADDVPVVAIDIAAHNLRRDAVSRASRLPRVLRGIVRFARLAGQGRTTLYISVSGGGGQFYECVFLLLARVARCRIFLHHHNYAYLNRFSVLTKVLTTIAGRRATHIVLSDGMARTLRVMYGSSVQPRTVSNAGLLGAGSDRPVSERSEVSSVGFLGNISVEKGILEFLEVVQHANESGIELTGIIAGPFQDAGTAAMVEGRMASIPNVEYRGPVFGSEKEAFFDAIDVLLFPTMYVNEAEPLVIHEAMARGVPVIARPRGAISEIITPVCGALVPSDKEFSTEALRHISAWLASPSLYRSAAQESRRRFRCLRDRSITTWSEIQAAMTDGPL